MKNTSGKMIVMAVGLGICLSAIPVSVKGSLPEGADAFQGEVEDISYIVDFFDYDGNFLDSRICIYGEKLEDIKVPERAEDEEYTYRFTGWEPGLCEIVTESAAYMAVYEKIPKDGSDPVIPEVSSNSLERAEPGNIHPESPKQISSISYEVVPIPAERSAEAPAEESAEAPAETPDHADG